MNTNNTLRPLFVDLDGTLIAADLGQEAFFAALKAKPWIILAAPFYAAQGLAKFKSRLAEIIVPEVQTLPYYDDVLAELKRLKAAGHPLILTTASHRAWAEPMAQHLALFDDVLATDAHTNLKGANKLAAIQRYCQEHGWEEFEYWGDAPVDLRIWSAPTSARIVAVNPSTATLAAIRATGKELRLFQNRGSRWASVLAALRPQAWLKYLLLFVPLLLSEQWRESAAWQQMIPVFVAFCLTSAAISLLVGVLNVTAERQDPTRRSRPFAAGRLPLIWGPILAGSCFLLGQLVVWLCLPTLDFQAARLSILLLAFMILSVGFLVYTPRQTA